MLYNIIRLRRRPTRYTHKLIILIYIVLRLHYPTPRAVPERLPCTHQSPGLHAGEHLRSRAIGAHLVPVRHNTAESPRHPTKQSLSSKHRTSPKYKKRITFLFPSLPSIPPPPCRSVNPLFDYILYILFYLFLFRRNFLFSRGFFTAIYHFMKLIFNLFILPGKINSFRSCQWAAGHVERSAYEWKWSEVKWVMPLCQHSGHRETLTSTCFPRPIVTISPATWCGFYAHFPLAHALHRSEFRGSASVPFVMAINQREFLKCKPDRSDNAVQLR